MDSSISKMDCGLYCVCSDQKLDSFQWMRLSRSGVIEIHFNNGKRFRKNERGGAYECVHSPLSCDYDSINAETEKVEQLVVSVW